jgi:hypothetical protein
MGSTTSGGPDGRERARKNLGGTGDFDARLDEVANAGNADAIAGMGDIKKRGLYAVIGAD